MAHTYAEDMICPGCGQPKEEAWNPDSEGWYEHREATCQGCAALQRAADGEREHRPERKRWVVDTRPPDVELRPWIPGSGPGVAGMAPARRSSGTGRPPEDQRVAVAEVPRTEAASIE